MPSKPKSTKNTNGLSKESHAALAAFQADLKRDRGVPDGFYSHGEIHSVRQNSMSRDALYRRLKSLRESGVLEAVHGQLRNRGTGAVGWYYNGEQLGITQEEGEKICSQRAGQAVR